MYERLGAWSETSAVVEALKQGIIQLEDIEVKKMTDEGQLDKSAPLTERQTEILRLTAEGKTNFLIGLQLGIKERTVKSHYSSRLETCGYPGIFERLNVQSRTAAVVRGLQLGLFSLEDISS